MESSNLLPFSVAGFLHVGSHETGAALAVGAEVVRLVELGGWAAGIVAGLALFGLVLVRSGAGVG